ncbi:hypothetical protein NPS33_21290 [Pseudomonas putida]|uniref:hypothetical protein n=1 Tax=Pseudomonas putida TaxID=303 RepID=UPI0023636ADB|nr:hypothetical protein [Pseudomonas putida]MDD2017415.1 hypothetical protein [Pseudomonas putida]HDS1774037.1 hypothetical protein [Pseudomonas putida]
MTNLTIRKADKAELQFLIDCEMQLYAIRKSGFNYDYDAKPNKYHDYPRKHFLGAIEEVVEATAVGALLVVQDKLDNGYKLFTGGSLIPSVTPLITTFYLVKSPEVQAEDAKVIADEVTAKYKADIEAHNDKVYAQEAKAMAEEEARVAAQLKAEDAARAAAEFDKRVRERLRGMK